MKKKLLLIPLLAVCLLPLTSCKMASGVYGAIDGIVLCQYTVIEAAETLPTPLAHGANTIRQGSCDGEAFTSPQLSIVVRLHRVDAITPSGLVISTVCGQSNSTIGPSSGFKMTTGNTGCSILSGDLLFAESVVTGYIGGHGPYQSTQRSPLEEVS